MVHYNFSRSSTSFGPGHATSTVTRFGSACVATTLIAASGLRPRRILSLVRNRCFRCRAFDRYPIPFWKPEKTVCCLQKMVSASIEIPKMQARTRSSNGLITAMCQRPGLPRLASGMRILLPSRFAFFSCPIFGRTLTLYHSHWCLTKTCGQGRWISWKLSNNHHTLFS